MIHRVLILAAVASGLLVLAPDAPAARSRDAGRLTGMAYTSPANVLRAQHALERLGHLERGRYEPGTNDPPTVEAIRDFQRATSLRVSGWLDWDTFAMLPVDERPDKDDDGVPDADDRCAATKKGARVGHDGCPLQKD
jgi:hypothetical protein